VSRPSTTSAYRTNPNHEISSSSGVDMSDDNLFNQDHFDWEINVHDPNNIPIHNGSVESIAVPEGAFLIEDDRKQASHTCTDQEKGYVRQLTFVEQHCLPLYVYDELFLNPTVTGVDTHVCAYVRLLRQSYVSLNEHHRK
jgi:hypothetical protein